MTGTAKIYNDCAVGKAQHKNLPKATVNRATVPGKRMFIDISPPGVVSTGGYKIGYFVLMMHWTVDLVSSWNTKTCWHSSWFHLSRNSRRNSMLP